MADLGFHWGSKASANLRDRYIKPKGKGKISTKWCPETGTYECCATPEEQSAFESKMDLHQDWQEEMDTHEAALIAAGATERQAYKIVYRRIKDGNPDTKRVVIEQTRSEMMEALGAGEHSSSPMKARAGSKAKAPVNSAASKQPDYEEIKKNLVEVHDFSEADAQAHIEKMQLKEPGSPSDAAKLRAWEAFKSEQAEMSAMSGIIAEESKLRLKFEAVWSSQSKMESESECQHRFLETKKTAEAMRLRHAKKLAALHDKEIEVRELAEQLAQLEMEMEKDLLGSSPKFIKANTPSISGSPPGAAGNVSRAGRTRTTRVLDYDPQVDEDVAKMRAKGPKAKPGFVLETIVIEHPAPAPTPAISLAISESTDDLPINETVEKLATTALNPHAVPAEMASERLTHTIRIKLKKQQPDRAFFQQVEDKEGVPQSLEEEMEQFHGGGAGLPAGAAAGSFSDSDDAI
jgi:hypothetical protein